MYQDDKVSINWIKIGLRLVLILLIIFLIIKVATMVKNNKSNVVENNEMLTKISLMEKAGKKYFANDLLPSKSGDSASVTLQVLIDKELIEEIKDTKGKKCNFKESNVKVTRLDSEYQYKTTLKCSDYEDYINSFVEIKDKNEEEKVNTTTTTTKKVVTTTTKKTTTIKKIKVSFNSNGGSLINDQIIKVNDKISPVEPVRDGYTFVNWYYHGEVFDMNTAITSDLVLTAKWVKN